VCFMLRALFKQLNILRIMTFKADVRKINKKEMINHYVLKS